MVAGRQVLFVTTCGHCPERIKKSSFRVKRDKIFLAILVPLKGRLHDLVQFISIMGQMKKKIAKALLASVCKPGVIYPEL